MAIKKIIIKKYKAHQGEGEQYGFKGQALEPIEQELVFKVNEIIEWINNA